MNYRVRQRDLREMIRFGFAREMHEATKLCESGQRNWADFDKVCHSEGVYGISGGCVQDRTTGQKYVAVGRTADLFRFF